MNYMMNESLPTKPVHWLRHKCVIYQNRENEKILGFDIIEEPIPKKIAFIEIKKSGAFPNNYQSRVKKVLSDLIIRIYDWAKSTHAFYTSQFSCNMSYS